MRQFIIGRARQFTLLTDAKRTDAFASELIQNPHIIIFIQMQIRCDGAARESLRQKSIEKTFGLLCGKGLRLQRKADGYRCRFGIIPICFRIYEPCIRAALSEDRPGRDRLSPSFYADFKFHLFPLHYCTIHA